MDIQDIAWLYSLKGADITSSRCCKMSGCQVLLKQCLICCTLAYSKPNPDRFAQSCLVLFTSVEIIIFFCLKVEDGSNIIAVQSYRNLKGRCFTCAQERYFSGLSPLLFLGETKILLFLWHSDKVSIIKSNSSREKSSILFALLLCIPLIWFSIAWIKM